MLTVLAALLALLKLVFEPLYAAAGGGITLGAACLAACVTIALGGVALVSSR